MRHPPRLPPRSRGSATYAPKSLAYDCWPDPETARTTDQQDCGGGAGGDTSGLPSHSKIFIPLFFFNDPATPEIYPLSLHDALPICSETGGRVTSRLIVYFGGDETSPPIAPPFTRQRDIRSEEFGV